MKFIHNNHCSLSFLLPCPDLFITCHIYFGQMLWNAFIAPQNSHSLQSTFCFIVITLSLGSLIQFEVMYAELKGPMQLLTKPPNCTCPYTNIIYCHSPISFSHTSSWLLAKKVVHARTGHEDTNREQWTYTLSLTSVLDESG